VQKMVFILSIPKLKNNNNNNKSWPDKIFRGCATLFFFQWDFNQLSSTVLTELSAPKD
jgi:hypothetical protein